MNKGKLVLASLVCGLASTTYAQSSITLYGVVDVGVRRVNNEDRGGITSISSGGNRSSRFGIRGEEDLGNGLSVRLKLEMLVGADVGSAGSASLPGTLFNRGAFLDLADKKLGFLRLGYDFNPTYVTFYENDPWLNVGLGNSGNLYDTTQSGPVRSAFGAVAKAETPTIYTRNQIQYFSPNLNGFFAVLGAASSEGGTTATGFARQVSLRLGYIKGPVHIAVARSKDNARTPALISTELTDTAATAAYDFGAVKLAATAREFRAFESKQRQYNVFATVPVGQGRILASYGKVDLSGTVTTLPAVGTTAGSIDANDASMLALGYVYNLSRRTALYTTAARISNKGRSFLALPGGPPVTSANFAGRDSTGFDVGMWHNF